MRRNFPTVHEALADFHRKNHLRGDAAHTGISLALNAALSGGHAAQIILAGLRADAELRLKVIGIVNHTMVTTAHGQTADIMNELAENVARYDVERALEWKTAHYTILNPLCVGMVLAGAGCEDTDAIRQYALHTGKAFQITDDIMGVFGTDEQTGKSVMDDIREGKRTLISLYAIEHAVGADRALLLSCLGNDALTRDEFEQCQQIIIKTGALDNSRKLAAKHAQLALDALDNNKGRWSTEGMDFLRNLARGLLNRAA
jgi:geranylgeranyl pyrophosphate synthase